ncbi:uncharacterized protein LOC141913046 [Tubulanus polymorphus]|uniref:uncharacterized protein LOC141913046 n=1 Tax=Tubulanus polymorphus TaxID=672921 RepID=UPI003DA68D1D
MAVVVPVIVALVLSIDTASATTEPNLGDECGCYPPKMSATFDATFTTGSGRGTGPSDAGDFKPFRIAGRVTADLKNVRGRVTIREVEVDTGADLRFVGDIVIDFTKKDFQVMPGTEQQCLKGILSDRFVASEGRRASHMFSSRCWPRRAFKKSYNADRTLVTFTEQLMSVTNSLTYGVTTCAIEGGIYNMMMPRGFGKSPLFVQVKYAVDQMNDDVPESAFKPTSDCSSKPVAINNLDMSSSFWLMLGPLAALSPWNHIIIS